MLLEWDIEWNQINTYAFGVVRGSTFLTSSRALNNSAFEHLGSIKKQVKFRFVYGFSNKFDMSLTNKPVSHQNINY